MLVWVLGGCLLLSAVIAADLRLRVPGQADPAVVWMRGLALSAPALWTAGSPSRHPETIHPGVDLRFAAGLERSP